MNTKEKVNAFQMVTEDERYQSVLDYADDRRVASNEVDEVIRIIFEEYCDSDIETFFDNYQDYIEGYIGYFHNDKDFGKWYVEEYLEDDLEQCSSYNTYIKFNLNYEGIAEDVYRYEDYDNFDGYVFQIN